MSDPHALALADKHYSRTKVGASRFVRPGAYCALITPEHDALWVTVAQDPKYVDHAWAGAWECTIFRNESQTLSSELVREAVAVSAYYLGNPPALGMITFVDATAVRRKRDPGRCFLRAGFKRLQETTSRGLFVLQLDANDFPQAHAQHGMV